MGKETLQLLGELLPKGNARSSGYEIEEHEWYEEQPACVRALLQAESFDGICWDPCCGGGNIPRMVIEGGGACVGSDLIDRTGEWPVADFFDTMLAPPGVQHIICNPPFKLAQKFVERALKLVNGKVAIVQRLAFLEGQERRHFFAGTGLSQVWVHSRRQSMPPGGGKVKAKNGSTAYAWFVWRPKRPGWEPDGLWMGGHLP